MTSEEASNERAAVSRDLADCYCRFDGVLALISRKYAIPIICTVGVRGPVRYADIEESLAEVSSSTLSTRLEELTEAGVLHRQRFDEIPPRVEYTLTDEGSELCELLEPLMRWSARRQERSQTS